MSTTYGRVPRDENQIVPRTASDPTIDIYGDVELDDYCTEGFGTEMYP